VFRLIAFFLATIFLANLAQADSNKTDRAIELRKMELEAIGKSAEYEAAHPGESNPYTDYIRQLQIERAELSIAPEPRRRRSWWGRNWWWVIGIPVTIVVVSAATQPAQ
jgi:hypothetical protein